MTIDYLCLLTFQVIVYNYIYLMAMAHVSRLNEVSVLKWLKL